MQSDRRLAGMEVSLPDPHGDDLGGFFTVGGSEAQCAALPNDEEFRPARGHRGLLGTSCRGFVAHDHLSVVAVEAV